MVSNTKKVIAIYARKSLFTGKGDSIGAQISECKRFINYKFANVEHEIKLFQDEGWSGKTTDRPEFSKMIKSLKNKEIDYVISYKLDRLGRTARDLHNFLYELDKSGIIYLSATESYDTTNSTDRFMISILAAMAQMERERLAERVKVTMMQLAKKGRWLGGQTPLGFNSKKEIYIDDTGKERQMMQLTPNKDELKIIQLIYYKYLELGSMSQVRKYCLENSIKGKKGGDISTTTLKQILTSPIYVKSSKKIVDYLENQEINVFGVPNGNGMLTFNKTKEIRIKRDKSEWIAAVGKHKGVIDDNVWLNIQKQLQEQSEKQINSSGRRGTSHTALLSGIIKCAICGSNMVVKAGHKSKKNLGTTYSYYVCNKKNDSYGHKCDNKNVRVDEAEQAIISELKLYNKDVLIKNLNCSLKESVEDKNINITNNIELLKSNIKEKEKSVSNLVKTLSLTDNENTSKIILDEITNINNEIDELKLKLEKENIKSNEVIITKVDIETYIKELENFNRNIDIIKDPIQRKTLLKSIVKSIEWDGEHLEIIPLIDAKKK
ncbi:recombinase family protein [Clostridium sp. ZS2-4]|uniref:recombinase family protein n=1 Tax=Clostridium sp. ZS2-4 TaxID=2987703 RepID=UPI00227C0223|nr:recombinase family protein [Clostridium sp. ZS2-4]MCY6354341.1 recombinase family protein [Clostridium sp. ZS2-4]